MGQHLERIQPRSELFQADPAAQRCHRIQELAGAAQVGEYPGLRRLQPQPLAGHALGGQFGPHQLHQLLASERGRTDPCDQAGLAPGAFALAQHLDDPAHHPAIDLSQQAVLLGDAQEPGWGHQFAIDLHPQAGLVQFARLALQAHHRLPVQDETLAGQRLADALDPQRDALLLGAIGCARIEHLHGIATQFHRRGQALAGLGQDLGDAGDLLAHLHAADAGGHRQRALAHRQHLAGQGLGQGVGGGAGAGMVAFQQHREAVLAKARDPRVGIDGRAYPFGQGDGQRVGRIQADVRQKPPIVVRLQQQEAVLAPVAADRRHRVLQQAHEGGAVEQAGGRVALAQLLHLAGQFRVQLLAAAEHHLHAGLALPGGGGELQPGREGAAIDPARLHQVFRRRRLAARERLEQLLEALDVLRADQVQQRHALHLVERLEPEHLQVGVVGTDVHAFMDVGDRVARGGDQRVAAALGLAHLGLEPAQAAARFQVGPFAPERGQQVRGIVLEHQRAQSGLGHAQHRGLLDPVHQQQQWQVLATGRHLHLHLLQRHGHRGGGQHQVHRLAGEHVFQLGGVLRAQGPHRDAAVAHGADDRFGVLDAVVDDEQAHRAVFLHAGGRSGDRGCGFNTRWPPQRP